MYNKIDTSDKEFLKILATVKVIAEIERLEKELEIIKAVETLQLAGLTVRIEENSIHSETAGAGELPEHRKSQAARAIEIDEQASRQRELYSALSRAIASEDYEQAAIIKEKLQDIA